ncbi:hypothetical protein BMF94_1578 [Rhodotorula taiwanensis]|uniref:Palmitoyl-protein thioesterase 1 n=1 Tax=Rhodotorula taiwanensis TaxID=741276 RepID=A0A2S5BF04_9BASI|nr:hypothetical protein BMF94_1578 [Rhodotorula taiwanensis]
MKLSSFVTATATLLSAAWPACALPAAPESILSSAPLSKADEPFSARSRPVPIVIWHGLGDRFDNDGLQSLKTDLQEREGFEGVFVHIVQLAQDGPGDQRATFFGLADDQVETVCEQLAGLPELTDEDQNPSRQFDAIGFSQGGQFLRAVVERCNGARLGGVTMRNLITLGSQHLGISALPPCPPGSSPFSPCRLMHLSLVREGVYSTWAQRNIVPAQYFRDPERIDEYFERNEFLRDINNERVGDRQPYGRSPAGESAFSRADGDDEPRNETYKANLSSLDRFVMFRFSDDMTVIPPHSAHFTLPLDPTNSTCIPPCYSTPLPWSSLPLYHQDYVGLRALDESARVRKEVCQGQHMQIGDECWEAVVKHLGSSREGRGASSSANALEPGVPAGPNLAEVPSSPPPSFVLQQG